MTIPIDSPNIDELIHVGEIYDVMLVDGIACYVPTNINPEAITRDGNPGSASRVGAT